MLGDADGREPACQTGLCVSEEMIGAIAVSWVLEQHATLLLRATSPFPSRVIARPALAARFSILVGWVTFELTGAAADLDWRVGHEAPVSYIPTP